MLNNQHFIELVATVNGRKRTGRLRVGARVDGKLQFATFYFNEGQLHGCEFRDQSGSPAINELLGSLIVSSIFIQGDISNCCKNALVPEVETLLTMAQQQVNDNAPTSFDSNELKSITVDALTEFFGKRAIKLVEDIAACYPPETSAKQFLKECAKLASAFIGAKKAQRLFQPLFALI